MPRIMRLESLHSVLQPCQSSFIHAFTRQILIGTNHVPGTVLGFRAKPLCSRVQPAKGASGVPACNTKRARGRPQGNSGNAARKKVFPAPLRASLLVLPPPHPLPEPGSTSMPGSPLPRLHLHGRHLQEGSSRDVKHKSD